MAKIERVRKADWKLGRKSSKCTVYSIRQGKRQKARQPLLLERKSYRIVYTQESKKAIRQTGRKAYGAGCYSRTKRMAVSK